MLHTLNKKKIMEIYFAVKIGNVANNVDEHFKTNFVTKDL